MVFAGTESKHVWMEIPDMLSLSMTGPKKSNYFEKKMRPRLEPCATPQETGAKEEEEIENGDIESNQEQSQSLLIISEICSSK